MFELKYPKKKKNVWEANPLCIFSMKNRFLNISMQVLNIYIYIYI